MAKLYDYEPYHTDIPFTLNEGNLIELKDVDTDFGTSDGTQFEHPLRQEDFVTIDTTKDMTVKKAEAGDEVYGVIIDTPRWNGDRTHKIATVRVYGHVVSELPIGDDNTAINIGDSVELKSPNIFDKASSKNNTRVLRKKEALTGGTVTTLIGFVGFGGA